MRTPTVSELFRLFDRSPIGMYRSTERGRFIYANPAFIKMLGFRSVEDLASVNLADLYANPDERPRLIREYRVKRVIDGVRVRWRSRDGRSLIVLIYGHAVEDEGDEVTFDASVIDITEAEGAREELERTARTLDLVVQQMPAMYWLVDHELRIMRTGGAIEEILGYPSDLWLGRTLYEVQATEPGSGDPIGAHQRALAGETVAYANEYRNRQLSTVVAPHRREGKITGVIGTSVDVTAPHALERRMVDTQRAESLGVLAGGLAHDFNNLLVAILGNADLGLRDTAPGAPGYAALENVRYASLRAAELIEQLLAYSGRGGRGMQRVEAGPVVEELLRISAPTIPANIGVQVAIPAGLAIRGDPAQVRQVFLNLIANARDAVGARGGSISITASAIRHRGFPDSEDIMTAAAGNYLLLEVADDGPGIDREARRRIFDPFFTTKPSGHGLGLAAVLGIVRAHAGGLRLISDLGRGAKFQVLWPATTTPPEQPVVAPVRRTVLVIDDEDLVRDVVARMIDDLGYAALTAADGAAGLALLERESVDAVLVDLTMPHMNGADVVAALRARKPGLPVVLCSGFDREGRGSVAADAYLPKPFRIEALERTLAKLLG